MLFVGYRQLWMLTVSGGDWSSVEPSAVIGHDNNTMYSQRGRIDRETKTYKKNQFGFDLHKYDGLSKP